MEPEVLGLILAGGESRRMQGLGQRRPERNQGTPVRKALIECAERPLLDWVIDRVRHQASRLLISCGSSPECFSAWDYPCLTDLRTGSLGPLSGIHAGLAWTVAEVHAGRLSPNSALLILPCDTPFLPRDTADRLLQCAQQSSAPVIVAECLGGGGQWSVLLLRLEHRDRLLRTAEGHLESGRRSLEHWCTALGARRCAFHDPQAFANLNTPEDLRWAENYARSSFDASAALRTSLAAYGEHPIPVAELRALLLRATRPISARLELSLSELDGHVCAASLVAPQPLPSQDNAAMDGYALRSADLAHSRCFRLSEGPAILAGHPLPEIVKMPEISERRQVALRVMTGGILPEGFDAVLAQEQAQWQDQHLLVPAGLGPGTNVRRRGEDLQAGDEVLALGALIGPAQVGLLASLGIASALVRAPLRVALLSTGDELLDPVLAEQDPSLQGGPTGRIFDSNRYGLRALLGRWPAVRLTDAGAIPDRMDSLEAALEELARDHDLIISTGGVSVGDADVVRQSLQGLGCVSFCSVAMRPGRPFAVGQIGAALYFGLPGNPVAAMISFCVLLAPVIDSLLGREPRSLPLERGRALSQIAKRAGRTEFQRAALSGDEQGSVWVNPAPNQGSGIVSSLTRYPAIAVLEDARGTVQAGEDLPFVRLNRLFTGQ